MYERKLDFVLRILASQIRSWWWWQDNNIIPVIYYTIVCVYSYNNIITVPRCAVQTGPLFTKSYAEIFNHSKKFNIATRPSSATVRPLFPRGGVSLYFLKKSSKREFSLFFFCRYHSFSNDLLFVRKNLTAYIQADYVCGI